MKRISLFTSLTLVLVFSTMSIPSARNKFNSVAASGSPVAEARRDGPLSTLGPSIVSISGRQLMVRKRNPDGTLAPPAPYAIKGVDWAPARRETNTFPLDPNNVVVRRAEFGPAAPTDIPLIRDMNANTVRTYMDPPLDGSGMAVLDQLYDSGIMIVMTVDNGSLDIARVQQAVSFYKDHPAILMWSLGNEWNINPPPSTTVCRIADQIQQEAALIKALDPNHPVATSYGEIDIPGVPLADTQNFVNNKCPSVDVWSLNVFRGNTFGTLFEQWAQMTTKPMILGEFGTDAFRSFSINNPPQGVVDGTMQSQWVLSEWNHLFKNLSASDPAKVALGGFVFEFNDEWWKVPNTVNQQNNNGCGPPNCENHPDRFSNEEYYGIVTIDRQPRPIYNTLAAAFHPAYQPQSLSYRAMSRGLKAAEFPSQNGVARFFKEGAIFYQATGGGGGGRGFNVAAINPCTGVLIQPPQNFDTWGTRNTGTAMNAMVSFLNSLPNGTLILIAVADEAGLNLDNSCSFLGFPWVQSGIQTLQALGSQQIDEYCYQESWAMVAVKGEGVAREEQLGKPVMGVGTEASAQTTLPIVTTLSPTSQVFAAGSGNGSVNVNAPSGCAWTATRGASDTWITVATGSGTGGGTVNYSVSANTGASLRAGTITIGGQTFVVTQAGTPNIIQVTVQTNPSGRSFTVDGSTFTTTQVFNWTSGSCHTIATSSPQSGTTGTQYVWSSWSDNQAISHSVFPNAGTTYTANFNTQHFLTMNAGSGGTVSPPSGWFNSGQNVSISATPNSGCLFNGWSGSGSGSFSGTSNPASVTMNGPITQTASFNCTPGLNVALAANGGVATASSTVAANYPAASVNNGDRSGLNWAAGGGWNDATYNTYPDWVQVDFSGSKTINRIDVFTVQDNYSSPSPPTLAMTFATYGVTDFQVQYWDGSSWVTVPGGGVSGNNLVWRQFTFAPVTTTKVRVNVTNALSGHSRLVELEAWQAGPPPSTPIVTTGAATNVTSNSATLNATVNPNGSSASCFFEWGTTTSYGNVTTMQSVGSGTSAVPVSANLTGLLSNTTYHFRIVASNSAGNSTGADMTFITLNDTGATNVALAANGGVASASSTVSSSYPVNSVNNGDRRGLNWGAGGGWNDGTHGQYPDWVQVDFSGSKTINEIDVFTIQDNYSSPAVPTQAMTFSIYGITDFQVQYWNGSVWVTVPGGTVSGNNLVWRRFTFAPITTTKVRVNVTNALNGHSRLVELEAWQ